MSTKKTEIDEKQLAANFGENITALMDRQGIGAYDLADAVGISFMTVYRILRKERLAQLLIAAKLADYFGTTIDALMSKPKKI